MDMYFRALAISILTLFGAFLGPTTAYSMDGCSRILAKIQADYYARIDEIYATYGVRVLESNVSGEGLYKIHPTRPGIFVSQGSSVLQKRITLEHEAVHHQTDLKILEDPSPENIGLGIMITSQQTFHAELPEGYKTSFRVDEIKATLKESGFSYKLLKEFEKNSDGQNELLLNTRRAYGDFFSFARVVRETFPIMIKEIMTHGLGEDYGIKRFKQPFEHYDVIVPMKFQGQDIRIYIPLHETKILPGRRKELQKAVLAAMRAASKYAKNILKEAEKE